MSQRTIQNFTEYGSHVPPLGSPRLAFIQDALPCWGGAERLLAQALACFPGTPIYTVVHNPKAFSGTPLQHAEIQASFVDRIPGVHRHHRLWLPFYPLAVENFTLDAYDILVSFSYAAAHGILTRPDQLHLALFFTPLRYAYNGGQPILEGKRNPWPLKWLLHRFRLWDQAAANRPDRVFAISDWIASLVWNAYRRPAEVLYPPVEIERFQPAQEREDYYLCVSRLEPHKRLDILVAAFNQLGRPLLLVGEGRSKKRLQKLARPNIRFLGQQSDLQVAQLLSKARAFVHAATEDFGIALVEAQAAGCPVIAYGEGGARETVLHGQTGLLFPEQTPECLTAAVRAFEAAGSRFSPADLRRSAERFSAVRFRRRFIEIVQRAWEDKLSGPIHLERLESISQPALLGAK